MKIILICIVILAQAVLIQSTFANGACLDPDGDGWGWNGVASCIPSGSTQTTANSTASGACVDSDGDGWGWNGVTSCRVDGSAPAITSSNNSTSNTVVNNSAACVDSDGDGWGWNGVASCQVGGNGQIITSSTSDSPASNIAASAGPCLDPDGDGFGWNGIESCTPSSAAVSASSGSNTQPVYRANDVGRCASIDNLINSNTDMRAHVTDVILTAGQSNAAGNNTQYSPGSFSADQRDSRLLAWTSNNTWEVADPLSQTWDLKNSQPYWRNRPQRTYNHPAFQIGKGILRDNPCRVVAIIATAAPGQSVDFFLNNTNSHYSNDIVNKVNQAVGALPGKSSVDMIWWMQGETDEGLATGSPGTYAFKLNQLINEFRTNNWFTNTGYFLANETRISYRANEVIRRFGNDGNFYTDYSEGESTPGSNNYPAIPSEAARGVFDHFSAAAFRRIGSNVGRKYSSHKGF